ncbi:MAG TPA: protein kinase [Planctomycetota bacterium]|nr:protein kinase [Planctomycetota bacterium]
MSTTTDLPLTPSGPGADPPSDPDAGAKTGAVNDIRKFLDGGDDLPGPDAPLGEIATSRGYITDAQLEECLEEQKKITPHVLLGELLLRHKYITPEQLLRALAAQKKPEPAPQLPEGARIGKYSLIRELGRGGMGVVFEAEDPDLRRRVAIKVLKEGVADPAAAERMRREAAIAAQLRHPGIVSIHEVGTTKPRSGPPLPFFAMDFVEGRTLAELLKEGKTERKVLLRILEDVARAVAHAHASGVVHRDLKPANIIVEKSGRAVLSDFGIARATSFQTRITETSFVVGTPEYMAPEQIQDHADSIGPVTDIYALGVILYEILTGSLPHRAETPVGLMRKIISEDPVPPRKVSSSVSADLEVICLKALEKEGTRRYKSADAFADDLLRFRTGKPISARMAGPVSRLWGKLVRRKRTAALIGGAAAAALLAIVLLSLWARRERREAIRQLKERMETTLRASLDLRRAGDLNRMKAFAREGIEACEAAALRYPELSEPHALAGRMHRALLDDDRALAEQELALARDPHNTLARYERLVLTSRRLRRREEDLVERAWRGMGERLIQERSGKVRPEEVSVPPREKLAKDDPPARELRERMREDLEALESPETVDLGAAQLSCARGLVSRNRAPLQAALAKAPHLEEAVEALARLEEDAGRYDKAVVVWSEGVDHDKGCLIHLEGRGEARVHWGYQKFQRDEDPAPLLIDAIGDFTSAFDKDPRRDGALRDRGLAHFLLAASIGWVRRDDTIRQLEAAEKDLGKALALNPKAAATWMWRGVVRTTLSIYQLQDPMPFCQEAMADLAKAIECNPQGDEPYFWRAFVRVPMGIWLALQRQDIEPLYRESLADLEQALKLNPGRGETWLGRANIHLAWANWQKSRGRDATEPLRKAASDLDFAIQKLPDGVQARERRGALQMTLATMPGEDAMKRYRDAADDFEAALSRNPKSASALAGRAEARLRQAVETIRRGENPASLFEATFRDLEEAASSAPAAKVLRAEAYVRRGEWKAATGKDADADYQSAIAETKAALAANPFLGEAHVWQGRAHTLSAAYRPVPLLHYQEAINVFGIILAFSPDHLLARRFRADAYQRRATLKAARRGDAGADFQFAVIDLEHVLRLQPSLEPELRESLAACKAGVDASKR